MKNFSDEKLESYRQLQKFFFNAEFLVHFDKNWILYIDIDAFKKRGFETMIYHFKFGANLEKFRRTDVELIFFLNRLLNFVETRYWFTELEMTNLIWMIKRVKHMIKAAINITIVFIDHVVNSSIIHQIILNFSNTNKLNLRFVRAFTYFN